MNDFFEDKTVLITGGTGFVGKVLLEKILFSCLRVHRVILLLRPKGGQTAEKRVKSLLQSELFDRIRNQCPNQLEKVVSVCGDVTHEDLGLNPLDYQRIKDTVEVVFNSAATIRFDEPIRRALQLNVQSTQRVLRLAQKCARIQCLVHVSTAYCTRDARDVTEHVIFDTIAPERLLDACEWMDDTLFNAISQHVMSGRASTYHLTKAMAEQILASEDNSVPTAIVRPSIITASWSEPTAGWVDNYNGLTGYLVAAGKGVLRTLRVRQDFICDLIPVDIVVNTCLVSAWSVASGRSASPLVVNCTSGGRNGLTWREIRSLSTPALVNYPSAELFRFPFVCFHFSNFIHCLHLVIEHRIPAFIVDLLFRACGLQPILGKVYQKVNRSILALEHFTCNQWHFRTDNARALNQQLTSAERTLFPIAVEAIDWSKYFEDYVLGIRLHLLREDPGTLPLARDRLRKLYFWTLFAKLSAFSGFLFVLRILFKKRQK